MRLERLWLPGAFWTTNEAYRQMRLLAPRRSPGEAAAELRRYAYLAARGCPKVFEYASVWFEWWGSGREDPDAWTWAGKHVLDGITDAKVIASDRKNVYSVGGRCAQSLAEMRVYLKRAELEFRNPESCRGILVTMTEYPRCEVYA